MPHPKKVCPKCGAVTSRLRRHVETEHSRKRPARDTYRQSLAVKAARSRQGRFSNGRRY